MIELKDKDKIHADDYMSILLAIGYIIFALLFTLESIMSLLVYPLLALFFHGILKIIAGTTKRNKGNPKNLNRILFGIISIVFSVAFLDFFVNLPEVTPKNLIILAAYPITIVGFASIVKGKIIKIYSRKHRYINIIIGLITLIICMLALLSYRIFHISFFLFHIVSLSIALTANIISRAALYLSEFGLSLLYKDNYKLFFYIISDYLIFVNEEGNIILDKIN